MKKTTFYKNIFLLFLFLLCTQTFSQVLQSFTKKYEDNLKGDILVIGNNILNRDFGTAGNRANDSYDVVGSSSEKNEDIDMKWINIDPNGGNNFNSSSARLTIPVVSQACYEIVYAALYWSGTYVGNNRTPINKIRLKVPGSNAYKDLNGTVIYDYIGSSGANSSRNPYACFMDITTDVQAAQQGIYTVANITCSENGASSIAGHSAGWTMFVVYKDSKLSSKYITTYDGFTNIRNGDDPFKVLINGFKTNPIGPVKTKIAFAALEGDNRYSQDAMSIKGIIPGSVAGKLFCALRPSSTGTPNFFNSSINDGDVYFTNRNPNSKNTLGYDTGVIQLANPNNTVLKNNETGVNITLSTGFDQYFMFFTAFAVEIIEPSILLTKIVQDAEGNDIGNTDVTLGQILNYVIQFQNVGNDNATQFTIRDILPINTIFNYPADLGILPTGVTVNSYNAITREIVFNINNSIVEVGDGISEIRLKVQVVPDCNMLSNACSNSIDNVAYATYKGTINSSFFISDDPSINTNTGCVLSPQATNFLVGIDDCTFTRNEVLCGTSVTLTAASGYSSYSWSSNPSGTPVLGTNQTLTVSDPGIYYVRNTAIAPCLSINETITVTRFGVIPENPVRDYANQLPTCIDDGVKVLPKIFLCGANASRVINTNISDGSTLVWEKLNEGSCALVAATNCVNDDSNTCSWTQVATGPNYIADKAGEFRLTLNYPGGCFNRFYFVVYKNLLSPNYTAEDIICTSPGKITIGGFPLGYEYSLSVPPDEPTTYQTSNEFSITTPNIYNAHIRQTSITNGCVFTVPTIQIRQRTFTVNPVITPPLCHGGKGSVKIVVNDVRPQYSYSIYQGATLINSVGPIAASDYTFANLNIGTYTVNASTEDGCIYTGTIQIVDPPLLQVTANQTKPLTCTDGEVTVSVSGGTPNYYYYVNSSIDFQDFPEIAIPSSGTYDIVVVDQNNCSASTSITVGALPKPFYTVTPTDVECYGNTSGKIEFNVTNSNGYTLAYSIDDGVNYVASAVFSNLVGGTYNTKVRYTLGTSVCEDTMQPITINQPTSILTADGEISELAGCGDGITVPVGYGKARIINPQGGTPPYTYSFDGGNVYTSSNEAYIAPGTYTLYVQDALGCIYAMPGIVLDPEPLPPTIVISTPVFNCNGEATITAIVTNPPSISYNYNYFIDGNPNTNVPSNVFVNVPSGPHTISVEYIRVNQLPKACLTKKDFPVFIPSDMDFKASITNSQDVSCAGANDGTITITAQNFDPAKGFDYSIDNGVTWTNSLTSPVTRTGLANANYQIQVRYDNTATTCKFPFTQTIGTPVALTSAATITTPAKCGIGATITASATGGTTAYQYQLMDNTGAGVIRPYQLNGTFTDVPPGSYIIRAKDANNCTDDINTPLVISPAPTPTATLNSISDLCFDSVNQATFVVDASGGNPPYTYSLDGLPAQNSNTFTNVAIGPHTIVVTDSFGCTAPTLTPVIATPLAVTNMQKGLNCTAAPDALITVNVTGGVSSFSYKVKKGAGVYSSSNPIVGSSFIYSITAANADTYTFEITDALGCTATTTTIVNPLIAITATTNVTPLTCNGSMNGAVTITPAGGVAPYTYSFDGSGFTSNAIYSGLTASTLPSGFHYQVMDNKGCVFDGDVIVTQPPLITFTPVVTNMSCPPASILGSIALQSVTNGVAPFTYTLTNTVTNALLTHSDPTGADYLFGALSFGTYNLTVTDSEGCSATQTLNVLSPPSSLTIDVSTSVVSCAAGATVIVSISPTPVPIGEPYTFGIYEMDSAPFSTALLPNDSGFPLQRTFTGLTPGVIYTFVIYDSITGCYYFQTAAAAVAPLSTLKSTIDTVSPAKCKGTATGTVSFTVFDYTGTSIDYEVFQAQTNISTGQTGTISTSAPVTVTDFGTLAAGEYYIQFTESDGTYPGCKSASAKFTIIESATALTGTANEAKKDNCMHTGQITTTAQGGTAPYQYELVGPVSIGYSNYAYFPNPSSGLFPTTGNYTVNIKDSNGCVFSTTEFLGLDPAPVVSASINPLNQCAATEGNFPIDVTVPAAGIPPYSFKVDGGTFETRTAPFTINLSSGPHTFTVMDANGCENSDSITILAPLGLTPAIVALPTCTQNGEVNLIASGGSTNYEYNIDGGVYTTSSNFIGVTAGTHAFEVKDTTTNCIKSVSVNLETPTLITGFALTPISVICNGGSDGSIIASIDAPAAGVNDNPPYTYSLSGTVVRPAQVSNIFNNLLAGVYTVTVTSGRGCPETQNTTITAPNPIGVLSPTVVEYGCDLDSNVPNYATITIDPLAITGGSGVYTRYEFIKGTTLVQSGTNPAYIESDLSGGNYTIYVYDNKGCMGTTTAIINPFININNPTVTIDKPITCVAGEEITVGVTITGGISSLQYTVKDIVGGVYGGVYDGTNTSGSFTGLPIGDYKITVYNPSTGCSVETTHQVNNPNTFDLQVTKNSDVVCYGTNGGSVDLTFINRMSLPITGGFNYTITGPVSSTGTFSTTGPITISNLTVGSYTVTATLTDITGPQCEVTSGFTIDGPTAALAITETHTTVTCASNDGFISASATGGWPGGYEYQLESASGTVIPPWSWSTVYNFTGLSSGNYRVRVRDSKGCPVSLNINLDNPTPLSITASPNAPSVNCFGDTSGMITVNTTTGGQGSNYMYTLNTTSVTPNTSSGPQSSLTFNNLGAGTYTVTVTDGYSCPITSLPMTITEPAELVASLNRLYAQTCTTPASLTLNASGGTHPYTASSDGISYASGIFAATTTFLVPFASAPTTYHYYVKDANGCTSLASNDVIINPLEPLSIQLDYTNTLINCHGESTGVIVANAIGGIGGYTYTLLDANDNDSPIAGATQTTPGYFTQLPAGSYKVHVVSGLDCDYTTETIPINEPDPLDVKFYETSVLCNGFGNGEIKIVASGGTPIITYAISPQMDQFFNTGEFSPLNPGTYDVYTQDEKGCFSLKNIKITQPDALNGSINIMQQELCAGDKTGEFNITITGGEAPYATSLDNPNAAFTEGNFNFSGLAGGEHTVYVRDGNGCESDWIAALDPAVLLNPKANATYDCVDNLSANRITVIIDPSNTNPSLISYSLDGNPLQPSNLFTNVPPGNHFVSVKHNNGCEEITDPFPVDLIEPLTISINLGELNQIVATTTGGSGVYQYTVNGELIGSKNTYIYYKSGNYTFTVTDSNGCTASASKAFDFIDIEIPNVFTPNGNGTNDNWQPTKTENYPNIKFIIHDRYGREIGTFGSGQFWDGKYKGTELPTGDYWYILKLNNTKDDRDFVGHFTLYR